jgi:hypothetical protein
MNKKQLFWILVLIAVDALLIPIASYRDAVGLVALWTLIPFELIHTIPLYFFIKETEKKNGD